MTTREDYVENILYCFSDEEVLKFFGLTKNELESGAWNQAIEFAYSELVAEEQYELEKCGEI